MLSTRTFVLGIIAIAVLVVGAYMLIAPRAAEKAEMGTVPSAGDRTESTTLPTSAEVGEPVTSGVGGVTRIEDVSVDTNAAAPTSVPTAVPATSPVTATSPVAPTEDPVPISVSGTYTLAEVALHAGTTSCWSVIRNTVYDLTAFVEEHPGGERNILKICGKDGTSYFEGKHGGNVKQETLLTTFEIGKVQ